MGFQSAALQGVRTRKIWCRSNRLFSSSLTASWRSWISASVSATWQEVQIRKVRCGPASATPTVQMRNYLRKVEVHPQDGQHPARLWISCWRARQGDTLKPS
jgi:hypothetical protein